MTSSRGFTMIEVLIAMVILAIGLLGLAALQAVALRNNHSALLRSQATLSAYDMADRMRSNSGSQEPVNYSNPASTAVSSCETTAGCDSAQMATNDMYEWSAILSQTLPSGVGIVCPDSTPEVPDTPASPRCGSPGSGLPYAIKIWWQDDRDNPGTLQRFVVTYQ